MSVAIPWARPDYSEYHPRQLPKYHQAYAFRTSSDYASSKPSGEYAANHLMPISPGSVVTMVKYICKVQTSKCILPKC